MFELLFKYPATVFSKGQFVLLSPWPVWALALAILMAGAALFWHVRHSRSRLSGFRPILIWLLETSLIALILFLLWHPAISIATLRPQQNIVSVLIDDSQSMAIRDDGKSRLERAMDVLNSGLLNALRQKFQVRLYRFGKDLERIESGKTDKLAPISPATHIGEALKQASAEASTLPVGALVLLSDGADNAGGIDLETISEIRQRQIPVHTIGFGREKLNKDVELTDVVLPARTLADSRLNAQATFVQYGYASEKAKLSVRDGDKVLASQDVVLKKDGSPQTESLLFNAGVAGVKAFQISIEPLPGEENKRNNVLTRLVNVQSAKPRILYVEGEPRWEFKFIRRAAGEDRSLELLSMLRTTQNKIYRQGFSNPKELEEGFPATAEELFTYQGLIIGSVEAGYFTAAQQELVREFANRRGGGVLFLAGRFGLTEGGYANTPFAELLPVRLPSSRGTFHRDEVGFELTPQGRESLICRLEERPEKNVERWKKMPVLANYQEVGERKPGAVGLMDVNPPGRRRSPLLVLQNYGRGRTAVFATAGSWRWRMMQDHTDRTHEMFWQQLLRWLVSDTPGQVMASTPHPVLSDETTVHLRAEVRDKAFRPMSNARVEAHIVGPQNLAQSIELAPQALEDGVYTADWNAEAPGSYVAEISVNDDKAEVGRDVVVFRREDGVAENFRTAQNRELLEKLAEQTGGRYYRPENAAQLGNQISYSEAGITVREMRDLWDMPVVFLLAVSLRAAEWLLRRKWGVI